MGVREDIVQLTKELVAIPSVSEDAAGRDAVIDRIEQFCRDLPGVHVQRYESNGFPSLIAAFDDQPAKALVLNAHVDVVPARPDQFESFERDGRIYGRGTQDMKGAAAAMLVLLKTLAERGDRPNIGWQFVTDEEIGGSDGVGYLLKQGYTADFFIAGEPTDLRICHRAKGILWTVVTQIGNPAHGSRPWDGENPIVPLMGGLNKVLERYPIPEAAVWRTTITPSALHSGDAINRVPVEAQLKLDIRRVPTEAEEAITQFLRECFPQAEINFTHCGTALDTRQDDAEVAKLAQAITAVTGAAPDFYGEHFGSDARFYSEVNVPAVCFGPVGAGLHSHEEWVDIASLETFYQILAVLAEQYT